MSPTISTHAPLARRDLNAITGTKNMCAISTHAPLARRDFKRITTFHSLKISTHAPLARRDSNAGDRITLNVRDFYSRASREARQYCFILLPLTSDFYSRASREARQYCFILLPLTSDFYSRASREARRKGPTKRPKKQEISTHAPLARRDQTFHLFSVILRHFYSRASREARLVTVEVEVSDGTFLLTRLSRGATKQQWGR